MLTLSTESLKGYGLNRIFDFAKEAGYDGIDLSIDSKNFDSLNGKYVKEQSDRTEIPVLSVTSTGITTKKSVLQAIEIAKEIGTKIVVLQPPKLLEFSLIKWLKKEVPKIRSKNDISIALENAPAGTYLGFIPEYALSKTTDLKSFKHVALDTSRLGENKKDIIRSYALFKKYLVHVHLSNVKKGKKYSLPEEGILPLESLLTKMKQDGYAGSISIKVSPKKLQAGKDEKVLQNLKNTKKFYDKYFTAIETVEND